MIKEEITKANLNKDTELKFKPDINVNDDLLKQINNFGEINIKGQDLDNMEN